MRPPRCLHGRLDERAGVLAHELVKGAFDEAFGFLSRAFAGADDRPDRLLARRVLGFVEVALVVDCLPQDCIAADCEGVLV